MTVHASSLAGTRLLLCRHGQTDYNASFRFQGQIDASLSKLGRRQSVLLGERLRHERIDAVYSSDLERARDTASLALEGRDLPLHLDARLREVSFGRWEGLTYAQIEERYPEEVAGRQRDRIGYAMQGGESLAQLAERIRAFLEEILPRHAGQNLLIVSHGGSVNGLISVALDIPLGSWWRLRNHNANLSVIAYSKEGARLSKFNDICHLDSLEAVA